MCTQGMMQALPPCSATAKNTTVNLDTRSAGVSTAALQGYVDEPIIAHTHPFRHSRAVAPHSVAQRTMSLQDVPHSLGCPHLGIDQSSGNAHTPHSHNHKHTCKLENMHSPSSGVVLLNIGPHSFQEAQNLSVLWHTDPPPQTSTIINKWRIPRPPVPA